MSNIELPPGPTNKFKNGMKYVQSIYNFFNENYEQYGDVYTVHLPGMTRTIVVNTPEHVKKLFSLKADEMDQSKMALPIDTGNDQIIFLNGDQHRKSRELVMPFFMGESLKKLAPQMFDVVNGHLDHWQVGDDFDLANPVGEITLDLAFNTLMGIDPSPRRQRYKEVLVNWLNASSTDAIFFLAIMKGFYNWRQWLNKKYQKRLAKGDAGDGKKSIFPWKQPVDLKVQLAQLFIEDIRRIRAEGNPDNTELGLFETLCFAKQADGNPWTEEQIISESIGMLLGGYEIVKGACAWHMIWMAKRPDVYSKCREEVEQSVAEKGGFDPVAVSELPYCSASINESMRLTTSAPITMRHLIKDVDFGTFKVPAHTNVIAIGQVIHQNKEVWGEDAKEYKPERWLEPNFRPRPHEFFPFGGGRRSCIGTMFGRQLLRIIWASIYLRAEFDSPFANNDTWPGQMLVNGITEPAGGAPVTVKSMRSVEEVTKSSAQNTTETPAEHLEAVN